MLIMGTPKDEIKKLSAGGTSRYPGGFFSDKTKITHISRYWLGPTVPESMLTCLKTSKKFNPDKVVTLWIDSRLMDDEKIKRVQRETSQCDIQLNDVSHHPLFQCGEFNTTFPIYEKLIAFELSRRGESDPPPFYFYVMMSDILRFYEQKRFCEMIENQGKAILYTDDDLTQLEPLPDFIDIPKGFMCDQSDNEIDNPFCNTCVLLAAYGNPVTPLVVEAMQQQLHHLERLYQGDYSLIIEGDEKPAETFKFTCGLFTGPFLVTRILATINQEDQELGSNQQLQNRFAMSEKSVPDRKALLRLIDGICAEIVPTNFKIAQLEEYEFPCDLFNIINASRYSQEALNQFASQQQSAPGGVN